MYANFTVNPGEVGWISSLEVSRVKISALQENEKASRGKGQACGENLPDSLTKLSPDGCWLKMYQGYSQVMLDGTLERFSEAWPRAGMTRSGTAYQRQPLAPLIKGIGSGLWPTPSAQEPGWRHIEVVDKKGNPPAHPHQRFYDKNTGRLVQKGLTQEVQKWPTPVSQEGGEGNDPKARGKKLHIEVQRWPTPQNRDYKGAYKDGRRRKGHQYNLNDAVRKWPTPTARDRKDGSSDCGRKDLLGQAVKPSKNSGSLNPMWVEWLMGYPIGWTDLEPLETPSSPKS